MKISSLAKAGTSMVLAAALLLGGSAAANAHGFVGNEVSDVTARAALTANTGMGPIQYEPQSIEGPKGFTLDPATGGPADGQLASAGKDIALNLDEQSPDRWVPNTVAVGQTINIGWKYTALHRTADWQYYITKNGWDQSKPLTRDELEPLATIESDGSLPQQGTAHAVALPADHVGKHVILAIWDIADTANAFYNAIDLDIHGDPTPVDPDAGTPGAPTGLAAGNVTDTALDLSWLPAATGPQVDHYEVQRAPQGGTFTTVGRATEPVFHDRALTAATSYDYRVVAVDAAGAHSDASVTVTVSTTGSTVEIPEWNPFAWYDQGDRVTHDGKIYEAVQSYQGHGDPEWIYAISLWRQV